MTINEFMYAPYAIALAQLGRLLPLYGKLPPIASAKRLDQWEMDDDEAPIFQFLYQAHQSRRHLEFGTWLVLCAATVWTINLATNGEDRSDSSNAPQGIVPANFGEDELGPRTYHRTDAGGYIGRRIYRERGLGHRVGQIYCSRDRDTANYPADFFDSVLIDGGHQPDVVINDSRKSLQVLHRGGLIMWHDFCPLSQIRSQFESVKGVTAAIESILPELQSQLERLCWINPSWIPFGIKT